MSENTTVGENNAAAPAPAPTPSNVRSDGGNSESTGNGNRQPNRRNQQNRRYQGSRATAVVFKGETTELHGHVFQLYEESNDHTQFNRTLEAVDRYCNKTFTDVDMRAVFKELKQPEAKKPEKPDINDPDVDEVDVDAYKEELKEYVKEKKKLKLALRALYATIWGQCSRNLIFRIEALKDHDIWEKEGNCSKLLETIRQIVAKFEHKQSPFLVVQKQLRSFFLLKQREGQSIHEYREIFQNNVSNIERYGVELGGHDALVTDLIKADTSLEDEDDVKDEIAEMTKETFDAYVDQSKQKFIATCFLLGGRDDVYGQLVNDLENGYLRGHDDFPNDVVSAYDMMANYKAPKNVRNPNSRNPRQPLRQGLTFAQAAQPNTIAGTDGMLFPHVRCFRCNKKGHYANLCPSANVSLLQDGHTNSTHHDPPRLRFGFFQCSYTMMQSPRYEGLNPNWVLLDSQSNCDIFCNSELLTNLRHEPGEGLTIHTNGGSLKTNMVGDVENYGQVWYSSDSLANILSVANVRKKFRIQFITGPDDSAPTIEVYRKDGSVMRFVEHDIGLYVHDVGKINDSDVKSKSLVNPYSFITTVVDRKNEFTKRQIKNADTAKELYTKLQRPSRDQFLKLLNHNLIRDCPITSEDANRAEYIYGADVGSLKGKTTRTKPSAIPSKDLIPIPQSILDWHKNVTLCVDIFFIHGIPFLHTISRDIKLRTVEELSNRRYMTILSSIQTAFELYFARGLNIAHLRGDGEFECIRNSIRPTLLHIASKGQHVPEVERSIRTIKERIRSTMHGLPYQLYPKQMLVYLVLYCIKILNMFPANDGVSKTLSPLTIMTGTPAPSYNDFPLEYGQYVQCHDDSPASSNTTQSRTTGAIAVCPSNDNSGWYFYSLNSGKIISRSNYTTLPLPADALERVHQLAKAESQNPIPNKPLFEYSPGVPISDDDDDLIDNPSFEGANDVNDETQSDVNDDTPKSNVNTNNYYDILNELSDNDIDDDEENENSSNNLANEQEDNENEMQNETEDESANHDTSEGEATNIESDHHSTVENQRNELELDVNENQRSDPELDVNENQRSELELDTNTDDTLELTPEINYNDTSEDNSEANAITAENDQSQVDDEEQRSERVRSQRKYNLRSKIKQSRDRQFDQEHYNYLTVNGKQEKNEKDYLTSICGLLDKAEKGKYYDKSRLHKNVVGICMLQLNKVCLTQMHASKGIKLLGDSAIEALATEYDQLDDLVVFTGQDVNNLTNEQKKAALDVIDLIKLKRCGKIKGRTVVDGRKQRDYFDKADTTSPAMTLESFIATLVIDAMEDRDVACADVAGAFLKADMPDFVILRIHGSSLMALLRANKRRYEKFVVIENGKRVLYVRLLKAMYGTLKAALLWYELLANTLVREGFKINAYDPCIANKIVNGKQFTICWYVDDLKLSHTDPSEVSKMLDILEGHFGKMNITRGPSHTYLGIDFTIKDKKVHLHMRNYLNECIKAFGEVINSAACSPGNKNLYYVNEESTELCEHKKQIFHHIVAKMLHICKRVRLDLQVTIGFLCTRVRAPTQQDWLKLKRLLQYVYGTLDMQRVVSLKNFSTMNIYVDAAHAVHQDRKSQTGGCIQMGTGVIHSRSSKQSINTKSSTESELVGASDYLPYAVWMLYFFQEQGYEINKKNFKQDNQSTIKILVNGKKSCGKHSRHVEARYFWTSNRLDLHHIDVEYCPTSIMLADFFTKPLQGSLFRDMCNVAQGLCDYDMLVKKYDKGHVPDELDDPNDPKGLEVSVSKNKIIEHVDKTDKHVDKPEEHVDKQRGWNLRYVDEKDQNNLSILRNGVNRKERVGISDENRQKKVSFTSAYDLKQE